MFDPSGESAVRHDHSGSANRRRRRALAAALCASIAVTVAGCGSAQPLTRAQLVKQADAICFQVQKKMKTLGSSNTPKQLAFVARKLAGFQQQELEQMQRLKPPTALASDWKKILEGAEEITENAGTLSTDIQLKKDKQAGEALKQIGATEQRVALVVKRDGLTRCDQLT
jgi:hypothetical protein